MKNLLMILLFLLISSFQGLYGQGWLNDFGREDSDSFESVIETDDNGYLALGYSKNPTTNLYEIILLRTDVDGNEIWLKYFGAPDTDFRGKDLVATNDGGVMILGSIDIGPDGNADVLLMKIDAQGNMEWDKIFEQEGNDAPIKIIKGTDNGFFFSNTLENKDKNFIKVNDLGDEEWNFTIIKDTPSPIPFDLPPTVINTVGGYILSGLQKVVKIDLSGDEIWTESFSSQITGMINLSDGNFLATTGNLAEITLSKRNAVDGEEIWNNVIQTTQSANSNLIPIVEANDGGFFIAKLDIGSRFNLTKTDHLGNEIFFKAVSTEFLSHTNILYTSSGDLIFTGFNFIDIYTEVNDAFLMKTDAQGNFYSSHLRGNIFKDDNQDCNFQEGIEDGLSDRIVKVEGIQTFYGTTDEMGNYDIVVDTGTYVISTIPSNPYWSSCSSQTINISEFYSDTTIDLGSQVNIECPWLTVDISTPFLRRCFENNYSINYCNEGTISAEDAFIEVTFDPFLEVQSSTLPWTTQTGNTYTFEVGTLDIDQCGSFQVTTLVNCDSTILGQTHCTEAHIFPDSICIPASANWDGSTIEVEATCDVDSVRFQINNIGIGNMLEPLSYIIIEDEIMVHQGDFQLNTGQSEILTSGFSSNGSTYRIIAEQATDHPGNIIPTAAIEGCGTTTFPVGFFNMFSHGNGDFYLATDCQENIGSYDPNDKQAFPSGYGDQQYIWPNIDIEYLIRFQNTGTDTAFTVVVRDTISQWLDVSSFTMGASSHNLNYTIDGEGVLKVTFDNILLVDSTTNELDSHGFFKYKIKQKTDNPFGTMIYNKAAIYFDFNAPIITNETFHEVAEPFMSTLVLTDNLTPENIKLNVFPNPFDAFTTFEIENLPAKETNFLLYDNQGQLVRKERVMDGSEFLFYRKALPSGLYFYKFQQNGVNVASGKMLAE